MKPIQLPLGVRLRDDATFINYYPGAKAMSSGSAKPTPGGLKA